MFLNFDTSTLEKLVEGVVLLDRYGQVTDFNHAAKPWLKTCAKVAEKISAVVAQTIRTNAKTPLRIDFFPADGTQPEAAEVMLCSDGKDGFALLITPVHVILRDQANLWQRQGIFHLIGDEVRHELTQLIQELGTIKNERCLADIVPVRERAQHLRSLFVAMEELSQIAQVGSVFPGERLSVVALLKDAIATSTFRHCDYYINASATEPSEEVGSVYGSASWIQCAFTALLQCLEQGAPRRSHIVLTVRQNGGFVVVTARPSTVADGGDAALVKAEPAKDQALLLAASIRVPLAQRIVALHGGQLKVIAVDDDDAKQSSAIASFTLQLPTGSPVNQRSKDCENCSVNQQALAYARDLVALLPSVRSVEEEVSEEERVLLVRMLQPV
jgi:hypothetical protein